MEEECIVAEDQDEYCRSDTDTKGTNIPLAIIHDTMLVKECPLVPMPGGAGEKAPFKSGQYSSVFETAEEPTKLLPQKLEYSRDGKLIRSSQQFIGACQGGGFRLNP